MATNGMVTIMDKGTNTVLIKVIVGCDGYLAAELVEHLHADMSAEDVRDTASWLGFGCKDCLVVMDRGRIIDADLFEADDETRARYVDTFGNPRFNPRLANGLNFGEIEVTFWQGGYEALRRKENTHA